MITHDKLFDQLLNNLRKLEGKTFKINQIAADRFNSARKNFGYQNFDIRIYDLKVEEDVLLYRNTSNNKDRFINVCTINELSSMDDFALALALAFAFALSFAFPFALAAGLAFALAFSEVDVLEEKSSCDGKVVEIDGKKYKLVEVV